MTNPDGWLCFNLDFRLGKLDIFGLENGKLQVNFYNWGLLLKFENDFDCIFTLHKAFEEKFNFKYKI
jgi:hypothetical protein